MYLHQWHPKEKGKGTQYTYEAFVSSPDYEWQYRFDEKGHIAQIGVIGWPNREECMVWQALLEGKAFELDERGPHITLHTTSTKRKAKICTSSSGMEETLNLISFIKTHRQVHLYHASQFKDGHDPRVLIFDQAEPTQEMYTHDRAVPVRTTGKDYYPPFLERLARIVTRTRKPKQA